MSGKSILITGNGGHAVSCREVIESVEDLVFSGFVTKDGMKMGQKLLVQIKILNLFSKILSSHV